MARPDDNNIEKIAAKFQALLEAPKHNPRPENSISVNEYAEIANVKYKVAGAFLAGLYKQGLARRYKHKQAYYYVLEENAEAAKNS